MSEETIDYPKLTADKCPIVEAVIDFRAKLATDFKVEAFAALRERLAGEYPQFNEPPEYQVDQFIKVEGGKPLLEGGVQDLGVRGHIFRSQDGKNIAQFRRDGFTFSRLKPYTSWEVVFAEASRLWELYIGIAKPTEVGRIATRYINRIPLPLGADFDDYLKSGPVIPPELPQYVGAFVSKVVIQEPATGIMANITHALEVEAGAESVGVILDIDVFHHKAFNAADGLLLANFPKLREMKNRIFFSSLTEKAIKLFL